MVNEQVTTIELTAGTPSTVEFSGAYPYYWVDNRSAGDVYASLGTPEAGTDGTYTIAAGSQLRISGGAFNTKLCLLGSGKVQVIASSIATPPFQGVKKGGGYAVAGSSSYALNNAVDYPVLGLNLYGKSTQDGTPTPENPIDIVSVGDSGSVAVQACGKNLLDYSLINVKNANGVGFTNNNDGSFTISGSKADVAKHFSAYHRYTHEESISIISQGNYTISGVPKEYGAALFFYMNAYYNGKSYSSISSTSNKTTCTITEDMLTDDFYFELGFYSNANKEIPNGTFYPQLEKGSTATDFEPYKGNIASITSALPLCGIPVSEGGNYTDGNGQQWVCDELIYNADGTGKIVKHTGKVVYDGSDDENWLKASTGTSGYVRFMIKLPNLYNANIPNTVIPDLFCDRYKAITRNDTWFLVRGICVIMKNNESCILIYDDAASNKLENFKSMLAANPVTVVYQLEEPQEIVLTASEMAQLRQLQTFDGITNITNGSGADMDVKVCTNKTLAEYARPITTGLQAQIDELKAAVLSLGGNV